MFNTIRKDLQHEEIFKFISFIRPLEINEDAIVINDTIVKNIVKNEENLKGISNFLKQLKDDFKSLLKEESKEKLITTIRYNHLNSKFNMIKCNNSIEEKLLNSILNEVNCRDLNELKTEIQLQKDILEDKNTEIVTLKNDIAETELEIKRVSHIIKYGVKTQSDLKLLKKYSFSSFCK